MIPACMRCSPLCRRYIPAAAPCATRHREDSPMRRFLSILFGDDHAAATEAGGFAADQVAAAVLMVETARLDGAVQPAERDRIQGLLARRFGLTPWVAAALLARAERTATESVAWQGLTHTLKESLDEAERI